MIGAFVGWGVLGLLAPGDALLLPPGVSILIMLVSAMAICGVLGVAIERYAYRPLRTAPRIAPLLSALGVSFFLQNSVLLTMGARYRSYRAALLIPPESGVRFQGVTVSATRILVIAVALVLMLGLQYFVRRTSLGRAMRATAQDREAAAMMGVDVDRVIVWAFFVGSALAGAAGVLVGILFTQVYHLMGFTAGLKGFTAAVLGGIGSIPGAMLGGVLLGIVESMGVGFISPRYKDLIAFIVLIALLLVRPTGLLGRRAVAKV